MDTQEYTKLMDALEEVRDPRKKRGVRYSWKLLLTLISAAMLCGQSHGRGIGQWVREHSEILIESLQAKDGRLPSESTLRRALQQVDVGELEAKVSSFIQAGVKTKQQLQGLALDGKQVRGAGAHGMKVHLVSLVEQSSAAVLAQVEVEDKTNEITAVPKLLAGRDLSGAVITVDALLAQRDIASQILSEGGHYLMVIKENQSETEGAIKRLFEAEWLRKERGKTYWKGSSFGKGHGRLETWVLESSSELNWYLM